MVPPEARWLQIGKNSSFSVSTHGVTPRVSAKTVTAFAIMGRATVNSNMPQRNNTKGIHFTFNLSNVWNDFKYPS
jgi:hypothetical protein